MLKFEISGGSLKITNDAGSIILLVAKKDVACDSLKLYQEIPIVYLYNLNLGYNSNLFNKPLSECVDSAGDPFTVSSFVAFVEANLGFNGGGTPQITVVENYSFLPNPTTVTDQFYWCETTYSSYPIGLYYSNGTSWEYQQSSTPTVVANYSALPDPTTVGGQFFWCSASQGTKWLPGTLGGTFYPSGQYYSNGTSWEYAPTPYQATQTEVNAGTNTDKFVTPDTFFNSTKWLNFFNLSNILGTSNGGTNANSYTAPIGTLCPLFYWDGTRFKTDSTLAHLSYDTATDTVYTGHLNVSGSNTQTAKFTNTNTKGASSGAGMQGYSDDGSAMNDGNRLAFYAFGGAINGSHTTSNASIIESFATEDWNSTKTGSNLVFSITQKGTLIRLPGLTIDGYGKLIINQLTADTVPYLDSDKILQSSTVTVAELELLAGKTSLLSGYSYSNSTPVPVTGTTSEYEVLRIDILPGELPSSVILSLGQIFSKFGTAGNCTWKLKMSTSSTMPSGTTGQIATGAFNSTTLFAGYQRYMLIIYGGNIFSFPNTTTTGNSDMLSSGSAISSQPFDNEVMNYLFLSVTNGSSLDTLTFRGIKISSI